MGSIGVLVVTPVYCTSKNRRLPMLLQNMASVQDQTFKDFLHVVVDDGSTDETPRVLEKIAKKHSNICILREDNQGSSAAVNFGVERSLEKYNPKYITIIHSDDLLTPTSLETRVKAAEQHRVKMVYSDMLVVDDLSGTAPLYFTAPHYNKSKEMYSALLRQKYIPYPTLLWDTNFFVNSVRGYDTRITSAEDLDIALRSAQRLGDGEFSDVNAVSVVNRKHAHNLGLENTRNGVKWKCYQMIFAKHLHGAHYYMKLARGAVNILRARLPENVKKPLRQVKRAIFPPAAPPLLDGPMVNSLTQLTNIDYRRFFNV